MRTRLLLPSLSVVTLALFANYAAILSVLVPSQVAAIDPEGKVGSLAIVTSVSFGVTLLAQPIIGALSDGTRGRLGRRAPWMIGCAVAAAGFMLGMGGLQSILWLTVFWAVVQFTLNGVDIATSSFLVDGFSASRRGVVSAVFGAGAIAGGAGGTILAGSLVVRPGAAYTILAIAVLVAVALFVVLNREPALVAPRRERFSWRAFAGRLLVDPRRHPDFAWLLGSRFFFVFSYYLVYGYLLYLVTDYVGVAPVEAAGLVGVLTVIGVASILVSVVVGGWWSDRTGRRRVFLIVACALLAGALIIPLVAPTIPGLVLFASAQGLGFGLYLTVGSALASQVLPGGETSAGRDLGIYNMATNLPQALAPVAAAAVIQSAGGYAWLFAVAIVGALLAALLLVRVREIAGPSADSLLDAPSLTR